MTDPMANDDSDDDSDDEKQGQVSQTETNPTTILKPDGEVISEGVLDAQGVSPQGVSPQTTTDTVTEHKSDNTGVDAPKTSDRFIPYTENTEVLYEDEHARESVKQLLTHTEQETQQDHW